MGIILHLFGVLALFFSSLVYANAQNRIDSLEKILHSVQKPLARVDALNDLTAYYLDRNIDKSLQYAQEARQIAEEQSYAKGEAVARTNIGNLYAQAGNYENAVQSYVKALKIVDDNQLPAQKLKILSSIGIIYRNKKDFKKAIKQFTEALQIAEKLNLAKDIADCENYLGGCYYLSKEYNTAIQYYESALIIREGLKDTLGVAKLKNNLGLILKRQGKFAEALKNFESTFKIQQKNKSKGGLAVVLDNIGDTYFAQKDFPKALQYQLEGLALAREVNNKSTLLDAYESLTSTYQATGDFEKAFEYQTQYLALQDSLNNQDAQKVLSEQHIAYQLEKQERELELAKQQAKVQKLEFERSKNIVFVGVVILFLFVGLLLSLYLRYQHKKQANELLEKKNIEIEHRVEEIQAQAHEIQSQNAIILDNHQLLTDSIQYAKRIQDAMLLKENKTQQIWQESFIFYQPKDIVSGDFYWFDVRLDQENTLEKVIIVVADCTGHGVPGAFMTVLGHSLLNQIIREKEIIAPSQILQTLDKSITKLLHQQATKNYTEANVDGMDIAIGVWDLPTQTLTFGSAKRPLYCLRAGKILAHKGGKFTIGGTEYKENKVFEQIEIQGQKGDVFYFFSDGYADQFGDFPNVKYTVRRLRELIQTIGIQDMPQQKASFKRIFEEWKGNQKQTDDVLLVGFKV